MTAAEFRITNGTYTNSSCDRQCFTVESNFPPEFDINHGIVGSIWVPTGQWDLPMLTGGFSCGPQGYLPLFAQFSFLEGLYVVVSAKFSWTLFFGLKGDLLDQAKVQLDLDFFQECRVEI